MALCHIYKDRRFNRFCNRFIKMPQPYPNRFKPVKGRAVPIPTYQGHSGTSYGYRGLSGPLLSVNDPTIGKQILY